MNATELNAKLKAMVETTATSKRHSKAVIKAITLKGNELEAKQEAILKEVAKISKQRQRDFNLLDLFYKGMPYKDNEGKNRIALSDGFRYKGISKSGKEYIGCWRI